MAELDRTVREHAPVGAGGLGQRAPILKTTSQGSASRAYLRTRRATSIVGRSSALHCHPAHGAHLIARPAIVIA